VDQKSSGANPWLAFMRPASLLAYTAIVGDDKKKKKTDTPKGVD
jgi:hypothetical protein